MCIVTFTKTFFSEFFLFYPQNTWRDRLQMSSRKMPRIFISSEPGLALKDSFQSKYQNINFHENTASGILIAPCRRTYRHSHGEADCRFSQLRDYT